MRGRKVIKYSKIFFVTVCIALSLSGCFTKGSNANKPELKYSEGKDTVESFGDGTFQMCKVTDEKFKPVYVLTKNPERKIIETDVYEYKEIKGNVYIYGEIGFSVLDSKMYKVKQFRDYNGVTEEELENTSGIPNKGDSIYIEFLDDYDDFTEEEKKIFEELKKKKREK